MNPGTQEDQTNEHAQSVLFGALDAVQAQRRIPAATYRLQFHQGFTFDDARALLGYLHDLGVSDLYASPIFQAGKGSAHGYDVVDPTRLNRELGSEADFERLTQELQERDMGLLLDIVPNHMGINDPANGWWLDVLENGPSSQYVSFFDIQWQPTKVELENKVLLPILGDQYGDALEKGDLCLNYGTGTFYLTYYDTKLPVAPRSYILILRAAHAKLVHEAAPEAVASLPVTILGSTVQNGNQQTDRAILELESIITALNHLPLNTETDPERRLERTREKEIIKLRLHALYEENAALRRALDATVEQFNGKVGEPDSFDLLDELINHQAYRLALWRVAGEEINYRRFFDINQLAAIRVEEAPVFVATHALAMRLLAEGKAMGLRIDHPDGLYDPVTYFRRLQVHYLAAKVGAASAEDEQLHAAIHEWLDSHRSEANGAALPLYVVAEKILSESEPLPADWMVFGTTGYDFLAQVNGLFVDERNEKAFTRVYKRFSGNRAALDELAFETKMMVMRESLTGEITALAYELERISERNRHYRDFTLGGLRTALREVVACLRVYRTYIDAHQRHVSERDQKFVQAAVREAKRRRPLLDDTLFAYLEETILLRNFEQFAEKDRPRVANWVMKFQQLTGPVMAKGVEDTAFYRYNRLVSLNEVGAHPSQFGLTIGDFHKQNRQRGTLWPHAMLATSTHDNKRSEDVRARLNVLSEVPDLWQSALNQWSRLNAGKKREVAGDDMPDRNTEYLFYQTLLGSWPLLPVGAADENASSAEPAWSFLLPPGQSEEYQTYRQRISDYMIKAVKEAKLHTSWLNPNEEYEEAVRRFVERTLLPNQRSRFLNQLAPLARKVAYFGHFNSLSQTLLKLTAPGVPDLYQGNELWDFSLVDPDNRRAVDYACRRSLLQELMAVTGSGGEQPGWIQGLVEGWPDGRIKLFVIQRTLHFRRRYPDLFAGGDYIPLETTGAAAQHLCGYLRQNQAGEQLLVVVPRLVATLTKQKEAAPVGEEVWSDTQIVLPAASGERTYTNLFTAARSASVERGGKVTLAAADLFADFPLALLTTAS